MCPSPRCSRERRRDRQDRVFAVFGPGRTEPALDLLELLELAWHDCYGEITPDESIVDDILVVSKGSMEDLIRAVRLAVTDWRDLKLAADDRRAR
jgi:hypothetical protein